MQICFSRPPASVRASAVALGNFDGVHLGHRKILGATAERAEKEDLAFAVWSFSRHPAEEAGRPCLLTLPEEKERLLAEAGVGILVKEDFSAVRDLSPREFCEKILVGAMRAKTVVCGFNFRFGKGAAGDADALSRLLAPFGVETVVVDEVRDENGEKISSSAVRAALEEGRPEKAARLLGRPYSAALPVSHGKALGRRLGFPTINQLWPEKLVSLRRGVYAVTAQWDGETRGGVCNFGVRPSVESGGETAAETYLFDFSGDLYGKTVRIAYRAFLREEKTFSSPDELKEAISRDLSRAKEILKEAGK